MSKILEAMRKTVQAPDGIFRLEALDDVQLFSAPSEQMRSEFEQLANSLIGRVEDPSALGHVYTFAATASGEGASFVSYQVARCLARLLERRVAWVDANFLSPQVRLEGHGIDFRNLLLEPAMLSGVPPSSGLTLIGNGTRQVKTTELLSGGRYQELLDIFRRTFAFTIIDAPPVIDSVETAHLALPTEGLILVVQSRRLKREIVLHGIEKLRSHGVTLIGTVLNMRTFDIPDLIYRRI